MTSTWTHYDIQRGEARTKPLRRYLFRNDNQTRYVEMRHTDEALASVLCDTRTAQRTICANLDYRLISPALLGLE